jgi:hypothetical protein
MHNTNLKKRVSTGVGGTALLLMSAPLMFGAQSVIMAPPSTTDTTPSWSEQESTNNEMQVFIPATDFRRSTDEPFAYGPFVLRPHVNYNFVYGTGLQSSVGTPQNSTIQTIAPGMSLDMGQHWSADYSPSLVYYSNKNLGNSVNQSASLNGATRYGDWNFGLSQTYTLATALLAETAQETKQEEYVTSLNAGYNISDRWAATFNVTQDILNNSGFNSSKTWSTSEGLNYTFWTRLTVGATVGAGYVDLTQNGNQQYQTYQGSVNWRATDKLSFSLGGGFEEQEFATAGEANALNPIFNAAIQYLPFQYTQLSLNASRTINTSDLYILANSQITTVVSVTLSQRLLEKFYLNLSLNYDQSDFSQSVENFSLSARTDNAYTFNAVLSHSFLKRGTIGLTYQYTENTSNTKGFGYNSSQVGINVGFNY